MFIGWDKAPIVLPDISGNTFEADYSIAGARFLAWDEDSANMPSAAYIHDLVTNNDLGTYAYATHPGGALTILDYYGTSYYYVDINAGLNSGDADDGDTLIVQSGSDSSLQTIVTDNLHIDAQAGSLDLNLALGSGIHNITLDDYTSGSGADVDVTGNALNNDIAGNSGDNNLSGGDGDDALTGGGGNDTLSGGAGTDTAVYATSLSAADFSYDSGTNTWTVAAGSEGTDSLTGIEKVATGGHHILLVDPDGSYQTIQEAVDAASDGDTILVAAGTYGAVEFQHKSLTIESVDNAGVDPNSWTHPAVIIDHITTNGASLVLDGVEVDAITNTRPFGGPDWAAILFEDDAGADNTLTVRNSELSVQAGDSQGFGLDIASGTGSITVDHVHVTPFSNVDAGSTQYGAWINAYDDVSNPARIITITDSTIDPGAPKSAALAFDGQAGGAVLDIHDNVFGAPGVSPGALRFFDFSNVLPGQQLDYTGIHDNTFTGAPGDNGQVSNETNYDGIPGQGASLTVGAADYTDSTHYASIVNASDAPAGQALSGSAGDDLIVGSNHDDTITAGSGSDKINGGDGTDTAVYATTLSVSDFSYSGGVWTVATGGSDGTDSLTGIEKVTDGTHHFLLVDPDGSYTTIQAAIDAASSGDTILVGAGTYNENLTIDKALTIEGANHGVAGTATRGAESVLNWTSGNAVSVSTTGPVVLDGLQLTGTHVIVASDPHTDVSFTNDVFDVTAAGNNNNNFYFNDADAFTFTNNLVDVTGYTGAFFQPVGSTVDTDVTIDNNTFNGTAGAYEGGGADNVVPVIANLSGVHGSVSGNTFNNVDIGVLVANTTGPLDITDNTFEHMHRTDPNTGGGFAAGVVFYQPAFAGTIGISGNSFSDTDAGVRTSGVPFTTVAGSTIDIHDNSFTDVTHSGYQPDAVGGVLHLVDSTGDATIPSEFFGGGSDDTIVNTAVNDIIHGGAGTDTVDYSETLNTGDFSYSAGVWTVTTGTEGTDKLDGVEMVATGGHHILLVDKDGSYTTIQAAVNAASAGDTILIAAGTYDENVVVDKDGLTLIGAGDTTIIHGTFKSDNGIADGGVAAYLEADHPYTQAAGRGVKIAADNVTLQDLKIDGFAYGIGLNTSVDTTIDGLTVDNVDITDSLVGMHKGTTENISDFAFNGGSISDGLIGIDFDKVLGGAGNATVGTADGVTFDGTDFSNLAYKGMYFEALSNAHLTNITMNDVGQYGAPSTSGTEGSGGDGIDLNLKNGTYSNIEIDNFDLHNAGASDREGGDAIGQKNGGAIVVEARDAGSYAPPNAGLITDTVSIHDGTIDGHTSTAIQVGEPGQANPDGPAVSIGNVAISGSEHNGGVNPHGDITNVTADTTSYTGTSSADSIDGSQSTGKLSLDGAAGDDTLTGGSADDTFHGGAGNDSLAGGPGTDTATYDDQVSHYAVGYSYDVHGNVVGFSSVQETNVTGTDEGTDSLNSIEKLQFSDATLDLADKVQLFHNSNLVATYDTIQQAVDAAAGGDTIHVGVGTFSNATINKELTIVGSGAGNTIVTNAATDGFDITGNINATDGGGHATVTIDGISFIGNQTGVRVSSTTVLDHLIVEDSHFETNTINGLGMGSGAPNLGDVEITGSSFVRDGDGSSNGDGDISLFGFTGNALLQDITIQGGTNAVPTNANADTAIQINGRNPSNNDVTHPIGNVVFDNVDVTGSYAKVMVYIQGYTNLDGLSFASTGTTINGHAGWGYALYVDPTAGETGTNPSNPGYFDTADAAALAPDIIDLTHVTAFNDIGLGLGAVVNGTPVAESVTGVNGSDALNGGDGNDSLNGANGNDALSGNAGNDTLDGGAGNDTMAGGAGDDTYVVDSTLDVVTENPNEGTDLVLSSVSYSLGASLENLTLTGTDTLSGSGNGDDNVITGNSGANVLSGQDGNDSLIGGGGADSLDGGNGADTLIGGDGADTLNGGGGTDTADYSSSSGGVNVDLTLATAQSGGDAAGDILSNIENVVGSASSGNTLLGNGNANALTGGSGADSLDGRGGADVMIGGAGDDTYAVDNASDVVTESLAGVAGGHDHVFSSISYTLTNNVEDLTLTGTAISGTGNAEDNLIVGNSVSNVLFGGLGNNTLDGGGGGEADTLQGSTGNDTYMVDNLADSITDAGGTDTVITTTATYTLGAGLENLASAGTADFAGTGNTSNNSITGNIGNDTLSGGAGIDTLSGGAGNDSLVGGAGADSMVGGDGNDTYLVDDPNDNIGEDSTAGSGLDSISSSVSYDMSVHAANVESLTLSGTAAINGTGNSSDNTITGNTGANHLIGGDGNDCLMGGAGIDCLEGGNGNDTLVGGAGLDVLIGGAGDDSYFVDQSAENITESSGNDTVTSSVTYDMSVHAAGVEDLVLTASSASTGTGNALDNHITGSAAANTLIGNDGNDTITGLGGADSMLGGAGDDLYIVDATDHASESLGGGADTVQSSGNWTLGANFEDLLLTGATAINGTGNADPNHITGNTGNNILDGGAGADTMMGDAGNDTYIVDDAGDSITDTAGVDTIKTSLGSYSLLPHPDIENLIYTGASSFAGTGNALGNVITGGSGNNTLDGGAGSDTLTGGASADTYIIDVGGDSIAADAGGVDTVDIAASSLMVSYTLGATLDNLSFAGVTTPGNFFLTGNGLANILIGNSGYDTLNGLGGADNMQGGDGNDTYVVDNIADAITDTSGTDTINTSLTAYSLAGDPDIENLTFTGGATPFAGTGNSASNIITGGTANDTLDGGGGGEQDTLIGGAGNDTYKIDNAADVINDSAGVDTVITTLTSFTLAAGLENLTYSGTSAFTGTGNALANHIIGGIGDDSLTGGGGVDVMDGGAGNDTYSVDNAGDTVVEGASGGTDLVFSSVNYTLAVNVENLTLTGTAISGTGNAGANTITGNAKANNLSGLGGNDSLNGGTGVFNDTLDGGAGADTLTGDAGNDSFVFHKGESGADTAPADIVTDFTGAGVAGGDHLDLFGYGAGSTIAYSGSGNIYIIHDGISLTDDHIQLTGVTGALIASDYLFH